MTTSATPVTGEEHRAAQVAEYGKYRANQVIYIDGVRAFNAGDPVPVSHIDREVVSKDQVDDVTTSKKG